MAPYRHRGEGGKIQHVNHIALFGRLAMLACPDPEQRLPVRLDSAAEAGPRQRHLVSEPESSMVGRSGPEGVTGWVVARGGGPKTTRPAHENNSCGRLAERNEVGCGPRGDRWGVKLTPGWPGAPVVKGGEG